MTEPNHDNDDETVIEKVADAVDDMIGTVLGEGLEPPEPEDRWERRQRVLNSWTAILLGLAAFATAWATFQASQWAGAQSDAQSVSATARSDTGRATTDAGRHEIVDSQMWLDWLDAVANGQPQRAAFLRARFSQPLAAAQQQWLADVPVDADGTPSSIPPGTPMDQPRYVVPDRVRAERLAARSEAKLAEADRASSNSTKFVLLAVLLALVLFLASIATKFSSPKIQVALISMAILLLAFCVVRMVVLPELL